MLRIASLIALLVCSLAIVSAGRPISRLPPIRTPTPVNFTTCGTSADLVVVSLVTADPYPPQAGKNITVSLTGVLSQTVNGGSYHLTAKLGPLTVLDQTGDLSEVTSLPLAPGQISISKTEALPSITPKGVSIDIQITATDDQNHELVCLKLTVSIPKSAEDDELPIRDSPVPYEVCDSKTYHLPVKAITASTWPPVGGTTVQVSIAFNTPSVEVTGGKQTTDVKIGGFPFGDPKVKQLSEIFPSLPLQAGAAVPVTTSDVSVPGLYDTTITQTISAVDTANEALYCIVVKFQVVKP